MEQKLVGTWQWQYIEGTGHMTFTRDHKILLHLPEGPGREYSQWPRERVTIVTTGTWRLDGDTLVLATDNEWLRAMYDPTSRHRPPLKKELEHHKILHIDSDHLVCEDRYSLDRTKGVFP